MIMRQYVYCCGKLEGVESMKVVALIPIKLSSTRIPSKNIKPFYDGTPLMSFIQRACLQSEKIDDVYCVNM